MIFNYEFSRNWWGFRWLNWVFNRNFAQTGDGFCPIFHLLWITILLSPFIFVIKIFGNYGTQFLNSLESWKRDRREKIRDEFLKKCNFPNLTPQQAYDLRSSKCWSKYGCRVKSDQEDIIIQLYLQHLDDVRIVRQKYTQPVKEFKESKLFNILSYVIFAALISCIGYISFRLYEMYDLLPVDWPFVYNLSKIILGIILVVTSFLLLYNYVIVPLFEILRCMECKLCKLGKHVIMPFRWLGSGLVIFGDMMYLIYKKACPTMTIK